ncbi:MAG: flagellar motor switch protein FliG [Nitrospirota bacterium]|nr:flagellar motor switch protein FliG [Nitrospirota bacterium]
MATSRSMILKPLQKVAVVLISLGEEASGQVLKHFKESDAEEIAAAITEMEQVPSEVVGSVLDEFHKIAVAHGHVKRGGFGYAENMLIKAFGPAKAAKIISSLKGTAGAVPFKTLHKVDAGQLLELIKGEHPQTIAVILAYLDPDQGGFILKGLPNEIQSDVVFRLANLDKTSQEMVDEVDKILQGRIKALGATKQYRAGGVDTVVELLNRVDKESEKSILETIEAKDTMLGEEIRKKMFVFDDLVLVDDRGIQKILKHVETKDLIIALKGAEEAIREKILKNMSQRAANNIREEMELLGPIRVKDVEAGQQVVMKVARKLEEDGEIVISGRGGEEVFV